MALSLENRKSPIDNQKSKMDLAALVVAMTFPSLMSWIEFWVLPGTGEGQNPWLLGVFGTGKVVQFSLPALVVFWWEGERFQFAWPNRRGIGIGILFALLFAGGAFPLYFGWLKHTDLFADTPRKLADWLYENNANTPAAFFALAFFILGPHSLLEEYYWRWFVFGRLQRHLPWGWAVVLASLAFMSHHVFVLGYYFPGRFWLVAVPFSLCVACAGGVWAWLYHRSGNLYAPWLSHLLADSAIMVVGYDMVATYW